MRVDPVVLKEIKRISSGILILDAIVLIAYSILNLLTPIVAAYLLGGSLVAIAGFIWLCMSVQKTLELGENSKGVMTKSYTQRMAFYFVWALIAVFFNRKSYPQMVAGLLPLLMPNIVIKIVTLLKYLGVEKEK